MTLSRMLRHLLTVATLEVATVAWSQQPFDLDTSFRTHFYNAAYVSSVLPTEDGKLWISGMDISLSPGVGSPYKRLNHDGTWDVTAPPVPVGGFYRQWGNQFYCGVGTPKRFFQGGELDTAFNIFRSPYYHPLQGGDYHVFPDGSVVISGVHRLDDTLHGYNDYYCLIWFTSNGDLDTAHHRTCAGSLDFFTELPNGQFIGSLGNPPYTAAWGGQATGSNVIRFNADGSLDHTFQSHVWWGSAYGYLPLPDGRVYVGGRFMIEGIPDTLNLVRFLPDGSLDPSFNNTTKYRFIDQLYPNTPFNGVVSSIYPLSDSQLIITGSFDNIDGIPRGSIALIDTSGQLLDDLFTGEGCGGYLYQPNTSQPPTNFYREIRRIQPAPDGSYYIYGAYQGYDDGTTNDTTQRFISRLHGLNVGIQEHAAPRPLSIAPNPASGVVQLSVGAAPVGATLAVHDASGRVVRQEPWPAGAYTHTLAAGTLAPGVYVLRVVAQPLSVRAQPRTEGAPPLYTGRLVVVP